MKRERERERARNEFLADASSFLLFQYFFFFFSQLLFKEEAPCLLGLSSGTFSLSLSFLFSFGIWVCNEMGILVLYCRSLQQSLMPFSMHLLLQTLYFRYWTLNSHYIIFNSIFSFTFLSNIVTLLGFINILICICLVGINRGLFHWDSYLKK